MMIDPDEFTETMEEIRCTFMPFGKYGPREYPPYGVPIYDLPYEYLQWFKEREGFPNGRIGELLELLYHLKHDGSDEVFNEFRKRAGGRTKLRKSRRKSFRFGD